MREVYCALDRLIAYAHEKLGLSQRNEAYVRNTLLDLVGLESYEETGQTYDGRSVSALKGDFFLLGCADCPSALVECGFLSNAEEERLLLTDEYQGKIARAVFEGVLSFLS